MNLIGLYKTCKTTMMGNIGHVNTDNMKINNGVTKIDTPSKIFLEIMIYGVSL